MLPNNVNVNCVTKDRCINTISDTTCNVRTYQIPSQKKNNTEFIAPKHFLVYQSNLDGDLNNQ